MAIEDDKTYGLTGEQIKELTAKVKAGGIKEVSGTQSEPTQMWTLEPGWYRGVPASDGYFYIKMAASVAVNSYEGELIFLIMRKSYTNTIIYTTNDGKIFSATARIDNGASIAASVAGNQVLVKSDIINNLTTSNSASALSAEQGKVLNNKIGDNLDDLITSDKTSLINAINEIAAGGGSGGGNGAKELTEADYNWNSVEKNDTEPFDTVALWKLQPGWYYRLSRDVSVAPVKSQIWKEGYQPSKTMFKVSFNVDGSRVYTQAFGDTAWSNEHYEDGVTYESDKTGNQNAIIPLILDSLTSSSYKSALSANQGKILNDKIGGNLSNLVTSNKTSLINAINEVASKEGGGGSTIKQLTSADAGSDGVIDVWNQPTGFYWIVGDGTTDYRTMKGTSKSSLSGGDKAYFLVLSINGNKGFVIEDTGIGSAQISYLGIDGSERLGMKKGGDALLTASYIENVLTSSSSTKVLSAAQGKALNDRLKPVEDNFGTATGGDALSLGTMSAATGDKSVALGDYSMATEQGEVSVGGTTLNGKGYKNTNYRKITNVYDPENDHDVATKAYVDANAGGGGGIKLLSTSDYDYPRTEPDGVALWQLPAGVYTTPTAFNIYTSDTNMNTVSEGTLIVVRKQSYSDVSYVTVFNVAVPECFLIDSLGNSTRYEYVNLVNDLDTPDVSSALTAMMGYKINQRLSAIEEKLSL